MKIFVVEDDFSYRSILVKQLTEWGYDPISAEDGEKAWKILQQNNPPKLILLDWSLPGLSGFELIKRIRNLNDHSPPYIIMVTAKSEKESIILGLDTGANDYVFKPCHSEILRARVNNGRRMLELQETLEHESSHDPLTGLLNRRAITESLSKELARSKRKGEGLLVGFCDLDHFKKINDEWGHQSGDDVLCGFVRVINESLRGYDSFGRWGGEEFLLIMPHFSITDAPRIFERLRATVENAVISTQTGPLRITISAGVAYANGNETVDEVLAAVDRNMYEAKNSGRNRICFTDRI